MKYLITYNESIGNIDKIKRDIEDICLELEEDTGIEIEVDRLKGSYCVVFTKMRGGFVYDDISEVMERLKHYMTIQEYPWIFWPNIRSEESWSPMDENKPANKIVRGGFSVFFYQDPLVMNRIFGGVRIDKTYENFSLDHLKERGIDPSKTCFIHDEQSNNTYFFLYNLTGELIGYQKYNPDYPKEDELGEFGRYFSYVIKEPCGQGKVAVYGLQTYRMDKNYLFVAEGLFDIIKIHNMDEPGVSNLGCSLSKQAKNWYRTLPQMKIVIKDKDEAGDELTAIADHVYNVPDPYKDLGEMPQKEVNQFIENIKKELGI